MTERLLITGGSGLLGSNIARTAAGDFDVYATYNSNHTLMPNIEFVPLDIRDKQNVTDIFVRIKPDLVIHTAALANVDYCEEHADEAWETNVGGTERVAEASKEIGARLIFISTDSVFDGEKGMYSEQDTPHPISTYAKTKFEGERRVQRCLPDGTIVRTAFYGWSLHNKQGLAEWVVSKLREGETIKMFTDVFFSPVLVNNLAEVLLEMYRRNLRGIFHVGCRERCTKYVFGQEIARAFGLDKNLIQPGSLSQAGLRAPRPKDISLDVSRVADVVNTRLLGVREGVVRFRDIEHFFSEAQSEKTEDR